MQGRTLQILVAGALVLLGTACAQGPAQAPASTTMPVAGGAAQAPGQAGAMAPPGTTGAAPTPGTTSSGSSGTTVGGGSSTQSSPSPSPSPPTTTPAPTTTMPPAPKTVAVAFVAKLPLDNPSVFNTAIPQANNPNGYTWARLWCTNLEAKAPGSICSATALPGSVTIDTVMTFPPLPVGPGMSSNSNIQAAATLATSLQQIAANPSSAGSLIPPVFGPITVSGVQPLTVASGPAGGPAYPFYFPTMAGAPAMAMAPGVVNITVISFTARLNYDNPTVFNTTTASNSVLGGLSPYQAWIQQLSNKYPSAAVYILSVVSGSVVVDTQLAVADNTQAANLAALLTAIQNDPSLYSQLFGTQFGPITVTGVNGVNAAATPSPAPAPAPHKLSGGKIAGAVIGSVAGAAILAGCGYGGYKYFHHRQSYQQAGLA